MCLIACLYCLRGAEWLNHAGLTLWIMTFSTLKMTFSTLKMTFSTLYEHSFKIGIVFKMTFGTGINDKKYAFK